MIFRYSVWMMVWIGILWVCPFYGQTPKALSPSTTRKPVPSSPSVASPQMLSLDYRKAIELALQQNFEIRIERYTPEVSEAQLTSSRGKFDPRLRLGYTYNYRQNELRSLGSNLIVEDIDGRPVVRTTGGEFDTGIVGLAPWGLTYDIGASVNTSGDSRWDYTRYNPFAGVNISQPLLRGFGTDVQLGQIRIARNNRVISDWELRGKVMDVITRTLMAYNEYYYAVENLKVEQKSRDLARQTLSDNMRRAEIGVMSPLDVTQARSDVAAREERVLVAEREMLVRENDLKALVSERTRSILNLRLQVAVPPKQIHYRIDEEGDLARSLSLRPDYRQQLLELKNSHITVVIRRNETLPRLDLQASFGVNGIDTSLYSGLSNLGTVRNTTVSAGVAFEFPIPNREARGRLDEAKLRVAQQLLGLDQLEQRIFVEVDNAAGQIETARKRIEATHAARLFAEETLAAAQTRLASGTSTTFEVLQFQRDLAAAQSAELRAYADHNIAIAQYALRTGTSLERAGIILHPGSL